MPPAKSHKSTKSYKTPKSSKSSKSPKFLGIKNNKQFNKIVKDITSLKIQGANEVAVSAVKAIKIIAKKSSDSANKEFRGFTKNLKAAEKILADTRPTEPAMRNILKMLASSKDKKEFAKNAVFAKKYFSDSNKKIYLFGAKKIRDNSVVYTHCHSSTVVGILKQAKKQKKNFLVCNTETRPLFQGRKTARELGKAGIHVEDYVDSAMGVAIKKSDIVLLGADAVSAQGVYNKIGSSTACDLAKHHNIPVYICTYAIKLDPASLKGKKVKIEQRSAKEVWAGVPKEITVKNPAFDLIDKKLIKGIISEFGIFSYKKFVGMIKKKYKWLF